MTQERLAEKAGLNRSFISKIESGETAASLETLVSIANALEVSSDDLLAAFLTLPTIQTDEAIIRLLSDCSPSESTILMDNMAALKTILRRFRIRK